MKTIFVILSILLLVGCTPKTPIQPNDSYPQLSFVGFWDEVNWNLQNSLDDDGDYGLDLKSIHIESGDWVWPVGSFPSIYLKINDDELEYLYLNAGDGSDADILQLDGTNNKTWEIIFKLPDSNFTNIVWHGDGSDSAGYWFGYNETTSQLYFYMGSTNKSYNYWYGADIELNHWYIMTIVWSYSALNGDSVRTFLDGNWVHSAPIVEGDCSNSYQYRIGGLSGDNGTLYLDEFNIFNRALQAPEIQRRYAIYLGQSGGGS